MLSKSGSGDEYWFKKDRIDERTILDYVVLDFHPKKKNQTISNINKTSTITSSVNNPLLVHDTPS